MAATTAKLGIKCKAYLNTGSYGTPTWTEITSISDWQQNVSWDSSDANTRASRVKRKAKTVLGLEWSGKLQASDSDTTFATIIAALVTDDVLDVLILNGDKAANGVTGYRCDVQVMSGNEDQGTGAVVTADVTLAPALSANTPQSVLVTTGAPVFTPLAP